MIVRLAHLIDADGIARVHVASWQATYAGLLDEDFLARMSVTEHIERHRESMTQARSFCLVAEDRTDGIIGFVTGGPESERDPDFTGEIYELYILPHHQRKGLGQMLMQFSTLRLRAMGHFSLMVRVLAGNPAEGFYRHLGGRKLRMTPTTVGKQAVQEITYVWADTLPLL